MKKFVGILLFAGAVFGQNNPSAFSGLYQARSFNYAPLTVGIANSSVGDGAITLQTGQAVTKDGITFTPVTTTTPITVGLGAGVETVTPTSVNCTLPTQPNTCQISATFSFIHGYGDPVVSGSFGLQEALNYAGLKGGGVAVVDAGWYRLGGNGTIKAAATLPTNTGIGDSSTGSFGGGSGSGTVTSVSDLPPLFTTSLGTTTPTFALVNKPLWTAYGNDTNGTAAPNFFNLSNLADNSTITFSNTTGKLSATGVSTVTSGQGTTVACIGTSCAVNVTPTPRILTTTGAITQTDCGQLVAMNSASPVVLTAPEPTVTITGVCPVRITNAQPVIVSVTPATSTTLGGGAYTPSIPYLLGPGSTYNPSWIVIEAQTGSTDWRIVSQSNALPVYDVTKYGAKCIGSTFNDAPGINAAIAAALANNGGQINFPPGTCNVNSSINLTNFAQGGILLHGVGRTDIGASGGTRILGNSGNAIIDLTGSSFVTIENMTLFAGATTPSVVGVLAARSVTNTFAQFNVLRNMTIKMGDDLTANNNFGTVGVYNYAAEIFDVDNVYMYADTPMTIFNDNLWSITSPNTTIIGTGPGHQQSMSVVDLRGPTTLWAQGGPALELFNAININLYGVYINSTAGNAYPYAIQSAGSNTTMNLNFNVEGFEQVWSILGQQTGVNLNANFNATHNAGANYIDMIDATSGACARLEGGTIHVTTISGTTHNLFGEDTTAGTGNLCGVTASNITLEANENIALSHGTFSGIVNAVSTAPTISVPGVGFGSYILNAGNSSSGISIVGGNGTITSAAYKTSTRCASSASPAVCAASASGTVAVPAGVNPTLVVNTTAVTANSQIQLTNDASANITTCNSTAATLSVPVYISARTAATSFTISYLGTVTALPVCVHYNIVN